jgi:hypothetical protein
MVGGRLDDALASWRRSSRRFSEDGRSFWLTPFSADTRIPSTWWLASRGTLNIVTASPHPAPTSSEAKRFPGCFGITGEAITPSPQRQRSRGTRKFRGQRIAVYGPSLSTTTSTLDKSLSGEVTEATQKVKACRAARWLESAFTFGSRYLIFSRRATPQWTGQSPPRVDV